MGTGTGWQLFAAQACPSGPWAAPRLTLPQPHQQHHGMGMGSLDPATKVPGPVGARVCVSVRVCVRAGERIVTGLAWAPSQEGSPCSSQEEWTGAGTLCLPRPRPLLLC